MKIVFLVQGEGRGHLTQAISLGQILRNAGHEITAAMVGASEGRIIPSFFEEQIASPVYHFSAPNIVYNPQAEGINLSATVYNLFRNASKYLSGLSLINQTIERLQPDLIISFYETYSGLYNVLYRSKVPMVCIAHQYLLLHPKFIFPKNSKVNQLIINFNSKLTSWLSAKRLALSFREMESRNDLKITVVPPLLRREVLNTKPTRENFLLVYMTHHSLSQQIINWHLKHPEIKLHCFWDNHDASDEFVFDETLTFHRINSEKYLRMLASCKALVTTAGFESVCEAMYLGKPVMMVPVPNHFEQECNATDGVISGAGVTSKTFDLSVILEYLPNHLDQSQKFRAWYNRGEAMFLKEIEVFGSKNNVRPEVKSQA
ncbi:glycosyltransferase family protein [Dyadobacter sp. CY326]|uniref:glycosyltransferase family protein n=1 Tax=Dyadobacter sp. CY326 TaxID=2907300 RepID=UPI001F2F80AB|nr:glycosyltransferase family protein [Dyadobacter sp. CY326]MCE7067582.1 glycosyl transferase [Dyadobacter sp. CY326]